MRSRDPTRPWAADLAHPLPLGAILALALNDHVLKGAGWLPGALTGKLSDVAGVFALPMVLAALAHGAARLAGRRLPRRPVALGAIAATGVGFAVLKLVGPVCALANQWWGRVVPDPTDVFVLPVLLGSWAWLMRRRKAQVLPARRGSYAALGVSLWACVATSRPPPPMYTLARDYPRWRVVDALPQEQGCLRVHAWVSKSGKQGLGVTVELTSQCEQRVQVRLVPGPLRLAQPHSSAPAPEGDVPGRLVEAAPVELGPGERVLRYISYAFDNERAWNQGRRFALLALGGSFYPKGTPAMGTTTWEVGLHLEHVRPGPYRRVPTGADPGQRYARPVQGREADEIERSGEYLP